VKAAGLLVLAALTVLPAAASAAGNDEDMPRPLEFVKDRTAIDRAPKPKKKASAEHVDGTDAEKLADRRLETLERSLKLDEDQKSKIRPILVRQIERRRALEKELREAASESNERIRSLLSDDQKDKFDELRVMARAQRQPQAPPAGLAPSAPPAPNPAPAERGPAQAGAQPAPQDPSHGAMTPPAGAPNDALEEEMGPSRQGAEEKLDE
jgi:hypothetical protein